MRVLTLRCNAHRLRKHRATTGRQRRLPNPGRPPGQAGTTCVANPQRPLASLIQTAEGDQVLGAFRPHCVPCPRDIFVREFKRAFRDFLNEGSQLLLQLRTVERRSSLSC